MTPDDIEKSVEDSLEEFVTQANAAFAEDFDGWDIAQTTAEVRFFQEGKKQQGEAAQQAAEAAKLQPKPAPAVAAESTAIVRPLPTPAASAASTPSQSARMRAVPAQPPEDKTVPMDKVAVEPEDRTQPQPQAPVAAPTGMSKGFLFATMLGAFVVGGGVVLLAVKLMFTSTAPATVVPPAPAPVAAPAVPGEPPA
ncbi:MAG TPA: hypothetical protein VGQ83_40770, partial [Polyangia bacterium]